MDVYLHMGFPKTGSSTLQFGLFKPLENSLQIKLLTWRKENKNEHLNRRPSSRLFNYQKIDKEYLSFEEDKKNILSDESFTAPLRLRMQNYGCSIRSPFDFPAEIKRQIEMEYLNENINYKIFITIRNQAKLIFSQYVEEYNWKIFKNIDLLFDEYGQIDVTGYEIYDYYKYVSILNKTFGEDSVTLTLFEDWQHELEYFCRQVSTVFNIPYKCVFTSLKTQKINAKIKTAEGVFSKDNRALVPYLKDDQNCIILDKFYGSNLKLADMLGLQKKFHIYGYIA